MTKVLPEPLPKKLNVGCGFDIRPDFLNVDSGDWHSPDLVADITDLNTLPSGHFDYLLAQDVLEHVSRNTQVKALTEWCRLLSDDGVIEVRVPSLVEMALMSRRPDFQSEERQQYLIQMAYGTQAYPGDFHLCGYTPWTVVANARDSGLIVVFVEIYDSWLYHLRLRRASCRNKLDNGEWLHNLYFSEFRRCVDADGFKYWLDRIEAGLPREQAYEGMRQIEFG